jgi:hypothetical protein
MKLSWETMDIQEIAAIVAEHLAKQNIDATLVGGACVSIYSHNEYLSSDLDFVTDSSLKKLEKALDLIGYKKVEGRLFGHERTEFVLDFLPPPVAIGQEPILQRTTIGKLVLLTPTDCVKDRLAAYYHWNDHQSLEQAIMVAKGQKPKINLCEIERWSKTENNIEKFKVFLGRLKK